MSPPGEVTPEEASHSGEGILQLHDGMTLADRGSWRRSS